MLSGLRQWKLALAMPPGRPLKQIAVADIGAFVVAVIERGDAVFGESDPARRRAAIEEIFTEDCVFYDPNNGVYRGRDEIDRVASAIRATHPDFQYQALAELEELGDGGRIRWVAGRPGEAPTYAGTDFIIARGGRIAVLYLFFDKLH
jgi:hypothetical protein